MKNFEQPKTNSFKFKKIASAFAIGALILTSFSAIAQNRGNLPPTLVVRVNNANHNVDLYHSPQPLPPTSASVANLANARFMPNGYWNRDPRNHWRFNLNRNPRFYPGYNYPRYFPTYYPNYFPTYYPTYYPHFSTPYYPMYYPIVYYPTYFYNGYAYNYSPYFYYSYGPYSYYFYGYGW